MPEIAYPSPEPSLSAGGTGGTGAEEAAGAGDGVGNGRGTAPVVAQAVRHAVAATRIRRREGRMVSSRTIGLKDSGLTPQE